MWVRYSYDSGRSSAHHSYSFIIYQHASETSHLFWKICITLYKVENKTVEIKKSNRIYQWIKIHRSRMNTWNAILAAVHGVCCTREQWVWVTKCVKCSGKYAFSFFIRRPHFFCHYLMAAGLWRSWEGGDSFTLRNSDTLCCVIAFVMNASSRSVEFPSKWQTSSNKSSVSTLMTCVKHSVWLMCVGGRSERGNQNWLCL